MKFSLKRKVNYYETDKMGSSTPFKIIFDTWKKQEALGYREKIEIPFSLLERKGDNNTSTRK